MDRSIHALMPAIHGRLTGGSTYNRRVLDYLGAVELHLDLSGADRSQWGGGLWLADSLCLETGAKHLENCGRAKGVLIAHYLKLLDPRESAAAGARVERAALRRYAAVITTSEFSRRAIVESGFAGEVAAILPGLDEAYRAPAPLREARVPMILTVANLTPDKGALSLLRALERLQDLDWIWELIGATDSHPEYTAEFERAVERSPVRDRVRMHGAQPPGGVLAAYDRSDLFALPSRFETCSMATMEAMARGLPVAAFRTGGLPDLLPEASRADLAEPENFEQLGATLGRFLADAGLRRRAGAVNRAASSRFPSWAQSGLMVKAFLQRMDAMIGI